MNTTWFYDDQTGRYVVKHARILFPNFSGDEQDYNPAGKRNFRLQVPQDLADELISRGVNVKEREPRDESEDTTYHIKVGVYRDADIRLLSGNIMRSLSDDTFDEVDNEYRKGHIINGDLGIEFHVSKNTRVMTSAPYARLDTAVIPIRKSRLLDDYSDYEDEIN